MLPANWHYWPGAEHCQIVLQGPLLAFARHLIHLHLTFMAIAAGWPATNSRHGEDSIREKRQTHGRGAGAVSVSIDKSQSAIASLDECRERDSTRCAPSSTLVCGCRRPIVKAQDPWDGISHEPRAQLNQLARARERVCAGEKQGKRAWVLFVPSSSHSVACTPIISTFVTLAHSPIHPLLQPALTSFDRSSSPPRLPAQPSSSLPSTRALRSE